MSTLAHNLGELLDIQIFGSGRGTQTHTQLALSDIDVELLNNLKSAGTGAVSAFLTAELLDALGINGVVGEVLNSTGGAVIDQILANITTPGTDIFADIGDLQFGNIVASYVGSRLASEVISFDTIGGQVGSAIGSSLGSIAAAGIISSAATAGTAAIAAGGSATLFQSFALSAFGGPVGILVGAFLGQILGGLIGSAFGGTPRSSAEVMWNPVTGEFAVGNVFARKGGSEDAARGLAQSAADAYNGVLAAVGGDLLNGFDVQGGAFGMRKSDFTYRDEVTSDFGKSDLDKLFDGDQEGAAGDLINYGAFLGLDSMKIAGGDVYAKRAFYNTLEMAGGPGGFEMETLLGNMTTASDYALYLQNSASINALIAAEPDSAFTAGWVITLQRAVELGLLKRHEGDWYGGFEHWLGDNDAAAASTATFTRVGNERAVILTDKNGLTQVVRDTIDSTAKDLIEGTAGNDEISLAYAADPSVVGGVDRIVDATGLTINGEALSTTLTETYLRMDGQVHVQLDNITNAPTTQYTFALDFEFNDGLVGEHSLFSYALDGHTSNEAYFNPQDDHIRIAIGPDASQHYINVPYNLLDGERHQIVASWDSATGDLKIWDFGVLVYDGVYRPGAAIQNNGTINIGQEQDVEGGAFDPNQSFAGKYFSAQWYNQALTPDQVASGAFASALVVDFAFDEGTGSTTYESVSGQHLAITDSFPPTTGTYGWGTVAALPFDVEVAAEVHGGDGDDVITGGDLGNDLYGDAGDDTITGGAKADWIFGGDGDDTLHADKLHGTSDGNYLDGGAGDDTLWGRGGSDWLEGGAGDDTLHGGGGGDILAGGTDGVDAQGNPVGDTLYGGAGDDQYILRTGDGKDTATEEGPAPEAEIPTVDIDTYLTAVDGGIIERNWRGGGLLVENGHAAGGQDVLVLGPGIGLENIQFVRPAASSPDLVLQIIDSTGATTGDEITLTNWFDPFNRIERLRFADGQEIQIGHFDSFTVGTPGNDVLIGTVGNDFIVGGDGDDEISLLLGNDFGSGSAGDDLVSGGLGHDIVLGADGEDVVSGGSGNDTVTGGRGDDELTGETGNDLLAGGLGNDMITTGAGDDVIRFERGDGADTVIDALTNEWDVVWISGQGFQTGYMLDGVQVKTTSGEVVYDGTMWLGRMRYDRSNGMLYRHNPADPNNYTADSGNDTIEFGIGIDINDIHMERQGDDLVLGIAPSGADGVTFAGLTDTITLKHWFNSPTANTSGAPIEEFVFFNTGTLAATQIDIWGTGTDGDDTVNGGAGKDWLAGNGGDDTLDGLGGDDILSGHSGQDTLKGGAGADVLLGGAGNDTLEGGAGADIIVGGAGFDMVSYADSMSAVTVDLDGTAGSGGDAAGDSIIEVEGIIGSAHADTLHGNFGDNEFEGGAGNDTIYGALGDDTYVFNRGDGADVIVDKNQAIESVVVINAAGHIDQSRFDVRFESESIIPGQFLNTLTIIDTFTRATVVDNYIWQTTTAMTLNGINLPEEVLEPGFSKAGISGKAVIGTTITDLGGSGGDDTISFGDGIGLSDLTLSQPASTDNLLIEVDNNGGTITVTDFFNADGTVNTDDAIETLQFFDGTFATLSDLEISGAGTANDDFLVGGAAADTLNGGDGDDTLSGLAGDDTLDGGDGDDKLSGGAGADTLTGGTGIDTAIYNGSDSGITVNLSSAGAQAGGDAAGDVLSGIENVTGSDSADTITGDSNDNVLKGNKGDDALTGSFGDDVLIGDAGTDTLLGGEGDDNISGGEGGTSANVEVLEGGAGNDVLDGGAGDDKLVGGIGSDQLIGGAGDDLLIAEYEETSTLAFGMAMDGTSNLSGLKTLTLPASPSAAFTVEMEIVPASMSGDRAILSLASPSNPDEILISQPDNLNVTIGGTQISTGVSLTAGELHRLTVSWDNTAGDLKIYDNGQLVYETTGFRTGYSLSGSTILVLGQDQDSYGGGYDPAESFSGEYYRAKIWDRTLTAAEVSGDANPAEGRVVDFDLVQTLGPGVFFTLDSTGNAFGSPLPTTGWVTDDTHMASLLSNRDPDVLVGGAGDDQLIGGAAGDILDGGPGDDTIDGGKGDDTYLFTSTSGNDTLTNDGGLDDIVFDNSVAFEDLTFSRVGQDLKIDVAGGGASVTVSGWFDEADNRVRRVITPTHSLSRFDIDVAFGILPVVSAVQPTQAEVDAAIAASWQVNELYEDRVILVGTPGDDQLSAAGLTGGHRIFGFGGNDTLTGGDGADELIGGDGTDTLIGGGGDDRFDLEETSSANDSIDGGTGSDTVDASNSAVAWTIDLTAGTAMGRGTDTLTSVENVVGSDQNDTITGNTGDNLLEGRGGNDTIDGGDGSDTAVYNGLFAGYAISIDEVTGLFTVADTDLTDGDDGEDTLDNIEFLQFADQTRDPLSSVTNEPPVVAQTIANQAATEDSLFSFQVPAATFSDPENDPLSYSATFASGAPIPVNFWLQFNTATQTFSGTPLNDDVGTVDLKVFASDGKSSATTTFSINVANTNDTPESLAFSGAVDENSAAGTVVGTATASDPDIGDSLTFSLQSDPSGFFQIDPNSGQVTVKAGASLNHEIADSHSVIIRVTDVAGAWVEQNYAITVNDINEAPSAITTSDTLIIGEHLASGGTVATFQVTDEDDITSAYGQHVWSVSGDNRFEVSAGVLKLKAGSSLDYEAGDTSIALTVTATDNNGTGFVFNQPITVTINDEIDVLNGGSGNDTLTGAQGVDHIFGNDGNDILSGLAGADLLEGGFGNDDLSGGDGADTLRGGAGDDTLNGNADNDVLEGGAGVDLLYGGGGDDNLQGGDGADTLMGQGQNDTLAGGAGDDILIGGAGADSLDGGTGLDTADYSASASAVTVDLAANTATGGDAQGDTFANIEKVIGTSGADSLTGGTIAETLDGGGGADTLTGGAGGDTLIGGAGNDTIYGGDGQDTLYGGDGDDTLHGEGDSDMIYGEAGNDHLFGGASPDTLMGGDGDDTLEAGTAGDHLYGEAGNDFMVGGAGADTYHAGLNTGQDVINDYDTTGSADQVAYGDNISYLNIWFERGNYDPVTKTFTRDDATGTELRASVLNTTSSVIILNMFDVAGNMQQHYSVELFIAGSMQSKTDVNIPALLSIMQGYGDMPTGVSEIPASIRTEVETAWDINDPPSIVLTTPGINPLDVRVAEDGSLELLFDVTDTGQIKTPDASLTVRAETSGTLFPSVINGEFVDDNTRRITLAPLAQISGSETFNVIVDDGGLETTLTLTVTVDAVADAPNLAVNDAAGNQGTAIALSITSSLADTDGSESLEIDIAGVPTGATLNKGVDQGGGLWRLSPADLTGLTITPVADNTGTDFDLTVTARATEASGGAPATSVETLNVSVNAPPSVDSFSGSVSEAAANGTYVGTVAASDPDFDETNLVDTSAWQYSTGTPTLPGWGPNNTNEIRWANVIGPDGTTITALETGQDGGTAQSGGGFWRTSDITIDPTKAYRYTIYFRKHDLNKHYLYFGPAQYQGAGANAYVENLSTGADTTNPYFITWSDDVQRNLLQNDRWYQVVGYVLPQGSTTGYDVSAQFGGVFDTVTGQKIANVVNYRWDSSLPDNVIAPRFFNYYDETEAGFTTYWAPPTVEEATLTYTLVDDAGGRFRIDAATGIVSVNDAAAINFEAATSHQIQVRVTDNGGFTSTQTYTVTVTDANEAPVLNTAISHALGAINEDNTSNGGTTIAAMLTNGAIDDPDYDDGGTEPEAIAVVAVDTANGSWEYRIGGGAWTAVGTVSSTSALLLGPNDSLRFKPNANWNGTVANGVTFKAWDQTSGAAGTRVDASSGGGGSAFSTATDTASVQVNAVNDAPVLSAGNVAQIPDINEDETGNGGVVVSTLLGSSSVSDVDGTPQKAIAVIGADNTNGHWEYNAGSGWVDFGGVSSSSARLLDSNDKVRFIPAANYSGTNSGITFRAWDQSVGSAGGTYNITATGGTSAFSTATAVRGITVNQVNDAPVLSATLYNFGGPTGIPDSVGVGHDVGSISATDVDTGTLGTKRYYFWNGSTISGTSSDGRFKINATTGLIEVNGALDFGSTAGGFYNYEVVVRDNFNGASHLSGYLQDTADVKIKIEEVNTAPVILGFKDQSNGTITSVTMDENPQFGAFVARVDGEDPDTGPNGDLTYSILSGNDGNAFSINSSTGEITINTGLDYETQTSYTLTVQATDGGNPSLSSTPHTLDINVVDVPEFEFLLDMDNLPNTGTIIGNGSNGLPVGYRYVGEIVPNGLGGTTTWTRRITNVAGDVEYLRMTKFSSFPWSFSVHESFYFDEATNELFVLTGFVPPLIIDLDGDGVELTPLATSTVAFDMDGDGDLDFTGWAGADDGFLALDRNGDGVINDASEISFVGDLPGARTDLEGIAAFDTNHDGVFDVGDERFGEFQVWQDANQDGVSQADELTSLADRGIASIDLTPVPTGETVTGSIDNVVVNTSHFTREDGTTGEVGDVALRFLRNELGADAGSPSSAEPATAIADETQSLDSFGFDTPLLVDDLLHGWRSPGLAAVGALSEIDIREARSAHVQEAMQSSELARFIQAMAAFEPQSASNLDQSQSQDVGENTFRFAAVNPLVERSI
ncbi:MAG: cadherin domain-containing protein [Sphingomonadales bacterium]|nr:cadherin domain-containing protein [Sphingomonadales bacterium]